MNTNFTDFRSQLDCNSRGSLLLLWIFRYKVLLGNLIVVSNVIRSSRAQPKQSRRFDENEFDLHAQRLNHPRKGPPGAIHLSPVVFAGTPLGAAVLAQYVPGKSQVVGAHASVHPLDLLAGDRNQRGSSTHRDQLSRPLQHPEIDIGCLPSKTDSQRIPSLGPENSEC